MEKNFTPIQEFGFSQLLTKLQTRNGYSREEIPEGKHFRSNIVSGDLFEGKKMVSSSSIFIDSVHFDLVYTPLEYLGQKVMTTAVSKIYAMNAEPLLATISVGFPNKISVEMVSSIYDGLEKSADLYKTSLRTTDVTAARENVTISVHVIGVSENRNIVAAGTCKPGDQVCVTGDLGGAMAGLRVLLREKKAWQESGEKQFHPDLEPYQYVVQRQLLPKARFDLLDGLRESGVNPSGMIDVSLGVMNEIQQLVERHGVGCELFIPALPIALETRAVADEMKEDVDRYACYGGEDYELLFTLKPADVDRLKNTFNDFQVIGEILEQEKGIVVHTGEEGDDRL